MAACLALGWAVCAHAAPDEVLLGGPQGYPRGSGEPQARHLVGAERPENLVDSFGGGLEKMLAHRTVQKGVAASALRSAERPAEFSYLHEGQRYSSDDYLARQRVTGLLVIKDGTVVLERYQYGRTQATHFLSA
ncbi:MAG: hypothetical protein V4679_07390 [Pseudomonadota bacterium]